MGNIKIILMWLDMKGIVKIESILKSENLEQEQIIDTQRLNKKLKEIDEKIYNKDINYIDEFENSVQILFENQKQNEDINEDIYIPNIPLEFDVIRD